VWVDWYEDRQAGRGSLGKIFDLAVASLPARLWKQGPAVLNARIKELIAEHTLPEPVPAQGPGPHFAFGIDLKIGLASPAEVDAEGNNLDRIRQLLPLVQQAARDLAGNLNPNTQPEIVRYLRDYRNSIAGEPERILWGIVFGLGVRLENAASAARRDIADKLREPLEDAAQEALDSVLILHGPLILATSEGRELTEQADQFRLTLEQRAALNDDACVIVDDLAASSELIEPLAAEQAAAAAEATSDGPHAERGAAYWLSTVKNIATVLLPVATFGAAVVTGILIGRSIDSAVGGPVGGVVGGMINWPALEVFKQTAMFKNATAALAPELNRVLQAGGDGAARVLRALPPFRAFVTRHEDALRRIADVGRYRWMVRYIDFIVRTTNKT
jgi:hypothetical protein